jgi:hypothetical protein
MYSRETRVLLRHCLDARSWEDGVAKRFGVSGERFTIGFRPRSWIAIWTASRELQAASAGRQFG